MNIVTPILMLLTIPLLSVGMAQTDLRQTQIPTQRQILDRIHVLTQLDTLFSIESIENIPASAPDISVPGNGADAKPEIKVTFRRGKLKLKSVRAGVEDKYDNRQFIVLLDAEAKNLIFVTSTIPIEDPDIHPDVALEKIEKNIGHVGRYGSFPTPDPKITFLEALEAIEKSAGGPFMAKEMEGYCAMRQEVGYLSLSHDGTPSGRAEWIITLRGVPLPAEKGGRPIIRGPSPRPKRREPAPMWTRNYMRHIVDATTGEWLTGGNAYDFHVPPWEILMTFSQDIHANRDEGILHSPTSSRDRDD